MNLDMQSIIESGIIIVALGWIIWGLRKQITALNRTVEIQNKTFETMEKRVAETEKVGEIYKKLIHDIPIVIDQYMEFTSKTKDSIIADLEQAKRLQDQEFQKLSEIRLSELRSLEQQVQRLPDILPKLEAAISILSQDSRFSERRDDQLLIEEFKERLAE